MSEGAAPSKGTVLAVRGAVVDARFEAGGLPQIDDELVIEWDRPAPLTVEVQAHLDETTVRGVARGDDAIELEIYGHPVRISSPGKVLFPERGETKLDLIDYYLATEPAGPLKKIVSIGQDPWMVREFEGVVKLKRADAAKLKATPLDANGDPKGPAMPAAEIKLAPDAMYYLIAP